MIGIFDKVSKQALPRILKTEIVCGDCGGDELLPHRTNLTSDGSCAVCGGRSLVIASTLCEALARHLKNSKNNEVKNEQYEQYENGKTTGNYIELGGSVWN